MTKKVIQGHWLQTVITSYYLVVCISHRTSKKVTGCETEFWIEKSMDKHLSTAHTQYYVFIQQRVVKIIILHSKTYKPTNLKKDYAGDTDLV